MSEYDTKQTVESPGALPQFMQLTRAYVPYQHYDKQYCLKEALEKGTLFPSLYFPEFIMPCNPKGECHK